MTLFPHLRFLTKSTTNNLTTMNAAAFMVLVLLFLTSMLAHADHLLDENTIIEQQHCQFCNQGIDTPPEETLAQVAAIACYSPFISQISNTDFLPSQFVQPPLRAPPFSQ